MNRPEAAVEHARDTRTQHSHRLPQADITCNECGAVVRTVPAEGAAASLVDFASGEICSARCTHCGALNAFPGFSSIEAFICSQCGEGVAFSRPVQ